MRDKTWLFFIAVLTLAFVPALCAADDFVFHKITDSEVGMEMVCPVTKNAFEVNKFIGAILASVMLLLLVTEIGHFLVHPTIPAKPSASSRAFGKPTPGTSDAGCGWRGSGSGL